MGYNDIKEICISVDHVFYGYNTSGSMYHDKLIIRGNGISYIRKYVFEDREDDSWEYSDITDEYTYNYKRLCHHLYDLICLDKYNMYTLGIKSITHLTDCGGFNIKVSYNGKKTDVLEYTSSFYSNNLDFIAYLIKKLIPNGKLYSDFLDYDDLNNLDHNLMLRFIEELNKIDNNQLYDNANFAFEYDDKTYSIGDIFSLISPCYDYPIILSEIYKSKKQIECFTIEEIKAVLTNLEHEIDNNIVFEGYYINLILRLLKRLSELCDM